MAASLLIEKIKMYRNVLYAFYFFNVLSVISGIVLSVSLYRKMDEVHWELIAIAVGTILFGIVLPYFYVLKIKQRILQLRIEVEKQVQTWVQGWFETYREFGEESFQKSEFWLKIVMLSVEQLSHYSTHPAVYMGAEISRIVRTELDKQKNRPKGA
ncbi:MAG: hypothetical protein V4596_08895 [Bdellovibrionota bacterium]